VIETSCPGRTSLPAGKIVCVGRNYADHAKEMGAALPEAPILFLKPPSALLLGGGIVRLPRWSQEVHHEVELVVRLGKGGKDVGSEEAARLVDAAAVGIDFTARDVQAEAKRRGEPWAVAKGWDGAAPVSSFVPVEDTGELADLELDLMVNGDPRQNGRTRDMIWPVPELLAFISTRFTLEPGDLVFTGTPAGVGPVCPGDRLVARLGSRATLDLNIQA
jgi:2-keto-4-pentenoate hydratase/2-oxohepta-3-ene-1,7-dioic acid hydratase in catechol pathway